MPSLSIEPFSDVHLDAAAALLADRHARQRRVEPLLPSRFEEPAAARDEIAEALSLDGASGWLASDRGRAVAYLIGARRDDAVWGPNVWVEPGAHAAADAEAVRDLYAVAAEHWVANGRTRHYVVVPASDRPLVDAWFQLSFGQQHVLAIQEVPEHVDQEAPERIVIRPATAEDFDALVDVDLSLPEHQQLSPVFSALPSPDRTAIRVDLADSYENPQEAMYVAALDGRVVATMGAVPVELSNMHSGVARPERACLLSFAATLPEARGLGAGVALTNSIFAWAREHRYGVIVTDYRSTNLLSSRFWPQRGFRPTFLRLYRSIP